MTRIHKIQKNYSTEIIKKEETISDYRHLFSKLLLEPEVLHYINNYIWVFSFRISWIIDGMIKEKTDDLEKIDEAIINLEIIKNKINDKIFRKTLIELHKEKKYNTNEMIKLII